MTSVAYKTTSQTTILTPQDFRIQNHVGFNFQIIILFHYAEIFRMLLHFFFSLRNSIEEKKVKLPKRHERKIL